jgi:hypothetical protein
VLNEFDRISQESWQEAARLAAERGHQPPVSIAPLARLKRALERFRSDWKAGDLATAAAFLLFSCEDCVISRVANHLEALHLHLEPRRSGTLLTIPCRFAFLLAISREQLWPSLNGEGGQAQMCERLPEVSYEDFQLANAAFDVSPLSLAATESGGLASSAFQEQPPTDPEAVEAPDDLADQLQAQASPPIDAPTGPPKQAEAAGVTLVDGGLEYRGMRHDLTGRPRAILEILLRSRHRTATVVYLRQELGLNERVFADPDQMVKVAACTLRAVLRKVAGRSKEDPNPLRSVGTVRDKDLAYHLALD